MHTDLLRTFIAQEGATVADSIVAVPIAEMGGGYGVLAHKTLSAGATIVSIPLSLMLTTRSAKQYLETRNQSYWDDASRMAFRSLTPVEILMSYLLLAEQDPSEKFYGWLRAMPRRYDNLLELPMEQELPNVLSGAVASPRLRQKVRMEQQRFLDSVGRCENALYALKIAEIPSSSHVVAESHDAASSGSSSNIIMPSSSSSSSHGQPLLRRHRKFLWAYNSLMSRGFAYDEDIWAMMPWVDYFNYSLRPNVTMRFNAKRRAYEFLTKMPVAAGEQLFLQYGEYSDMELALWYGFALRPVLFPEFHVRSRSTKPTTTSSSHAPERKQQGEAEKENDDEQEDDHEQFRQLNIVSAYVFSPTSDPNGDLPVGMQWAAEWCAMAGLRCPASWRGETDDEDDDDDELLPPRAKRMRASQKQYPSLLADVRLGWHRLSADLITLLDTLVEINGATHTSLSTFSRSQQVATVFRLLCAAELASFPESERGATNNTTERAEGEEELHKSSAVWSTAVRIATQLSVDHRALLTRFSTMEMLLLEKIIQLSRND
jgi:hypothetical protein